MIDVAIETDTSRYNAVIKFRHRENPRCIFAFRWTDILRLARDMPGEIDAETADATATVILANLDEASARKADFDCADGQIVWL